MKIIKYKKIGKNRYKIFFENIELILYEDIILKYNLLYKNDIDLNTLDLIIEDNKNYEAYFLAINYISTKMRTKKELTTYLKRKQMKDEYIDFAIKKVEELGLLNNTKYVEAYINDKINLSNDGPEKIKINLLNEGIDEEVILNYINKIDNKVWKDRVEKLINKKSELIKNKSYYFKVQKIKNDIYNLGYDKDIIESYLNNIKYDNSYIKKEYLKAKKKYNDNNKIAAYLLRKGYSYEEISSLTNEY